MAGTGERLRKMHRTLSALCALCDEHAGECRAAGAVGVEFAVLMLRQAFEVYSKEVRRYVESRENEDAKEAT